MSNDVYDREDLKQKEKRAPVMDNEGAEPLSPGEQASLDQMEAGFGEEGEEPDFYRGNNDEDEDKDGSEDDDEIPYSEEKPKRRRFRIRIGKKGAIGGGVAGLGIGGVFAVFSFVSGPAQLVHLSQLLQDFHFGNNETLTDNSAGDLIRYARGQGYRNNLGVVGNKLADHYDAKLKAAGLTPDYAGTTSIQAFIIDPDTPEGARGLDNMKSRGLDVDSFQRTPDGKIRAEIRGFGSSSDGRKIIRGAVDSIDLSGKSSALAKRLLIKRGAITLHPFKNVLREVGEETVDYTKRVREQNEDIIKNGADTPDLTQTGEDAPEDGDETAQAGAEEADRVASEVNEIVDTSDLPSGEAGVKELSGRLKKNVAKGVGVAAVASFVCVVQQFGESYGPYLHQNVVLPMMRLGMMVVSAGSQIQTGQGLNMSEVGVMVDALYDETNGTSAFAAESIQANSKQEVTGTPLPASMNPGKDKPAFFKSLDVFDGVCNAITSTLGQIGLSIAGAFASGGPASVITDFITDAVTGAALDAFNVFDNLARIVFGGGVSVDGVEGGLFGAMADTGVKVAANDTAIALGGRELSAAETARLSLQQEELSHQKLAKKSFYDRTFNLYDSQSLVGRVVIQNPSFASISASMESLTSMPGKLFGIIGSSFSRLLPHAGAQSGERYDYGFPDFGFSVEEQDNPIIQNPYENAEYVYNNRDSFTQYTSCYGTTVNLDTGVLSAGTTKSYSDLSDTCNNPGDQNLLRYRAYLLHTITAKTMLCYEGIDEAACAELGFGGVQDPSTQPGGGALQPVNVQPGDTIDIPCSAGLDMGPQVGYDDGQPFNIRTCNVEGIVVNSQISGNLQQLITDARAASINLSGGGFRTMEGQEEVFRNHCPDLDFSQKCNGAARPGYSNHQMGLAIDFNCDGTLIPRKVTSGQNKCFDWLVANAERYGLFEWGGGNRSASGYEAWHWSVDGN